METTADDRRASPTVVLVCLGSALLFVALTVLATQDKAARAASPWQDDPYDAVVSLAQFTVPMLALVIGLRLVAWRAPGGPDRAAQTLHAAGGMTALVALTLLFEWAATVRGAHASSRNTWTAVLVGGLAVVTLLTTVAIVLLVRRRAALGLSSRWRHDWLGDVILVGRRVPVVRRWSTPDVAAWVRRRAMTVFVSLSVLAAAGAIGALAVGERWTNPYLIAWALVVETTSNLAFCLLGNAFAGFVARPPRRRPRRVAEAAVVAGCLAIQVATAFRVPLWSMVGSGTLTSVPALAVLTLGPGLIACLLTAVLLLAVPDVR